MTTDTIGRVVRLPSAGSASFGRAGQPLGAGFAQIAASNAVHLAKEGCLRTLAEHPGTDASSSESWRALLVADSVESFLWDEDSTAASGVFQVWTGLQIIKPYGPDPRLPRVEARWRWKVHTGGDTAGAVLIVTPGVVRPSYRDHASASTTTTATSFTDATLTVTLDGPERCQRRALTPGDDEVGQVLVVNVALGFWNTHNQAAHPNHLREVSIFLREPTT